MKKRIINIFLCLIIVSTNITGADYLKRSYQWEVNLSLEDGIFVKDTITLGKDTIINGLSYRLIKNNIPLRQTSDSILMYDNMTQSEVILYNFALQVGDSLELMEDIFDGLPHRYAKVIKNDTISLSNGMKARRTEYEQTYPRHIDIEYVGDSERGILGPLDNMIRESQLIRFYDGDEVLYENGSIPSMTTLPSLCDEWKVYVHYMDSGPDFEWEKTRTERLTTDTLIGDLAYVKIESDSYMGALREGTNRDIYFVPEGSTHEYLLYAFNAQEGDHLTNLWFGGRPQDWPEGCEATIAQIEESDGYKIFTLDIEYRYLNIEETFTWQYQWIDGIGLTTGPTGTDCPFECGGAEMKILCAYKNGEQIYTSDLAKERGCDIHSSLDPISLPASFATREIRNGHLYIHHSGKTFSVLGAEVK